MTLTVEYPVFLIPIPLFWFFMAYKFVQSPALLEMSISVRSFFVLAMIMFFSFLFLFVSGPVAITQSIVADHVSQCLHPSNCNITIVLQKHDLSLLCIASGTVLTLLLLIAAMVIDVFQSIFYRR